MQAVLTRSQLRSELAAVKNNPWAVNALRLRMDTAIAAGAYDDETSPLWWTALEDGCSWLYGKWHDWIHRDCVRRL